MSFVLCGDRFCWCETIMTVIKGKEKQNVGTKNTEKPNGFIAYARRINIFWCVCNRYYWTLNSPYTESVVWRCRSARSLATNSYETN